VSVRGGEVSFTAKSGELTAIVGATGCGKSTLLSYITRFAQPESGEIFIGGRNIKAYDLEALRRNVSFAQSKPVLFSKTLRENLLLHGAPDDVQAMLLALKSAKCDFIASEKEDLGKYLINVLFVSIVVIILNSTCFERRHAGCIHTQNEIFRQVFYFFHT
jgi:ABC-type multidrug transport system fused ATPase/permease subunit